MYHKLFISLCNTIIYVYVSFTFRIDQWLKNSYILTVFNLNTELSFDINKELYTVIKNILDFLSNSFNHMILNLDYGHLLREWHAGTW